MLSLDCATCPGPAAGCEGCFIATMATEYPQVEGLSDASCGYVLSLETRAAVDVLRAAGLVSELRIVEDGHAA